MASERDNTLDAIRIAIRMEIDGKEFYLKSSQESSNELGTRLLRILAKEEDFHRKKFEEIYEGIRSGKAWPVVDLQHDRGKELSTVFSMATEKLGSNAKALSSEFGAIEKAMGMENKTYDFYNNQAAKSQYEAEKQFYQSLAAEESQHHRALADYYEFLKDPADWFTRTEHHSLDG